MNALLFDCITKTTNQSLSHTDRWVLAVLSSFARHDETFMYPSLTQIERCTGLTRTGVCRVLKRLLEKGVILKKKDDSDKRRSNFYQININMLVQTIPEDMKLSTSCGG